MASFLPFPRLSFPLGLLSSCSLQLQVTLDATGQAQGTGSVQCGLLLCLCSHPASLQISAPLGVGGGGPGWQVSPHPAAHSHSLRGTGEKGKCEKTLMGQDTDGLTRERNSLRKHFITPHWPRLAGNSGGHWAQALAQAEPPTASCPVQGVVQE